MFIVCPKCAARYQVPDDARPGKAAKFKCSACGAVFENQAAPETAAPPVPPKPPAAEARPPVLTEEPPRMPAAPAEAPETGESSEVFKTPLYQELLASETTLHPVDSGAEDKEAMTVIPSAFVPVEKTPKRSHKFVFIPLYLLFIGVLCWQAWAHRAALMPAFYELMPVREKQVIAPVVPTEIPAAQEAAQRLIREPVIHEAPEAPPRPQSAARPIVMEEIVAQLHSPSPRPRAAPAAAPVKAVPAAADEPAPQMVILPSAAPAQALPAAADAPDKREPESWATQFIAQALPAPTDAPDATPPPMIVLPETEDLLFEVMAPEIPAPPRAIQELPDVEIQNVRFRLENSAEGVPQLLIEGRVFNPAAVAQGVPELQAVVYDRRGGVILTKPVRVSEGMLPPRADIPLFSSVVPAPADIGRVAVVFREDDE